MPILLKKNEFAVTITYKCNWSCQYCAVRNKHDYKPDLKHDEVLQKLEKIPPNTIVTLFGGEPGLVSKTHVIQYMDILEKKNCTLYLETNGLFIKKYPDLLCRFGEILYHCSQELDIDDQILRPPVSNIRYMLIVHDKNINKLKAFLDKNNDLIFDIVEATYPYPDEMDGPRLSKSGKMKLILEFGSRMTRESFHRLLNGKDFDQIEFLT